MRFSSSLGVPTLLALASNTDAFTVNLWSDNKCAAAQIENGFLDNVGSKCQTLGSGEAHSATIIGNDALDSDAVVAFYSSSDCELSTVVGEADIGCIDLDSLPSTYKSFNVIAGASEASAQSVPGKSVSGKSVTGTIAGSPYGYQHGKPAPYANTTYVWHQVASNAWRGILPSEWDDTIHVRSFKAIDTTFQPVNTRAQYYPVERSHSRDISIREPVELFDRNFIYASCEFVGRCLLAGASGVGYTVGTVVATFLAAIRNDQGNVDVWNFLNSPFIIAITIGAGSAALSGAVSALTSAKITANQCSTQGTSADTINSIISSLDNDAIDKAIQAVVQIANGASASLSMEAVPDGQRGDGNTCGAPSTDPTTGG